jgi:hypothetical protein
LCFKKVESQAWWHVLVIPATGFKKKKAFILKQQPHHVAMSLAHVTEETHSPQLTDMLKECIFARLNDMKLTPFLS